MKYEEVLNLPKEIFLFCFCFVLLLFCFTFVHTKLQVVLYYEEICFCGSTEI
jgi:hypothetical protein